MYAYIIIQTIAWNTPTIKFVSLSHSKAEIELSRLEEEIKLKGFKDFELILETHLITS